MHRHTHSHHDDSHHTLIVRLLVIACLGVIATIVFVLSSTEACTTKECFELNMLGCEKARYINEVPEASWKYEINGVRDDQCEIEVTLLNPKQGTLGIDTLVGQSMTCFYPLEIVADPETNLDLCHGLLKESLQERIIAQLHQYIIGNLDGLAPELSGF